MAVRLASFNVVLFGDMAAKGFTALFALATIRFMAPEKFASFVYLGALIILSFSLVSGFFNRHYMLSDTDLPEMRAFQLAQMAATGVVIAGMLILVRPSINFPELLAVTVCPILAAAYDFCRTVNQRRGNFLHYSGVEVSRTLLMFVLALPIITTPGKFQVAGLIAVQAFSYACGAFLLRLETGWRVGMASWSKLLRGLKSRMAMLILMYWVLVALYGQVPILVAKSVSTASDLASLGSATRYYGIVLSIVVAANIVTLPVVSRAKTSAEVFLAIVRSRHMLLVATGMTVLCAAVGHELIPHVDGGKYPAAPYQFVVLCIAIVAGIPMAPVSSGLLRLGRVGTMIVAIALSVAIAAGFPMFSRMPPADSVPLGFALGALAQLGWGALGLWRLKPAHGVAG